MNRAEAAAILSVDPEASPEDARRAYQELFTEHQVRLTNAPTPALRSLYQARLLELDEAKDVLLAQSLGDADSDLPTDQPSIPSHIARDVAPPERKPPPPPPSGAKQSDKSTPPKPPAFKTEPPRSAIPDAEAPAAPKKKRSKAKSFLIWVVGLPIALGIAGLAVFIIAIYAHSPASSASAYTAKLPGIRENITVARVEFGRGDYDAANRALLSADSVYTDIIPHAADDTAVAQIKSQLDSLHGKVTRACDALKRVAERHPGEPTCKTI